MVVDIKTENSLYRLDFKAKTWERLETSEASGYVRTKGGTFNSVGPILKDQPLQLWMDVLPTSEPGSSGRLVHTSHVLEVSYPENKPHEVKPLHIYWRKEEHAGDFDFAATEADGLWYFWTESWADHNGPYPDFETATRKIAEYGNWLLNGDNTFYTSSNGDFSQHGPRIGFVALKVAEPPQS